MKNLILIFVTLISSSGFATQKNPQIRTCNSSGGEFVSVATATDQVGFCQFDKALIGSLDLMLFNNKEAIVQSVDMYMKNQTSCDNSARVQTVTVVGASETFKVCAYADGSFIELNTLTKGPNSSENQKLNQVLGL